MNQTSRRRDALIWFGVYLVLGLCAGALWWLVTPVPHYAAVDGQVAMDSVQLMRRVDADVSYVLIAGVIGLVSGAVLSMRRMANPLVTILLIALGSSIAGLLMWQFGEFLSPNNLLGLAEGLKAGEELPIPLRLQTKAALLSLPVAALCGATADLCIRRVPTSVG